MSPRFFFATLALAIPAALPAQTITDTHERVTHPGKHTTTYRPLVRENKMPTCHPDWSKSVACRGQQNAMRLAAERAAANEMARR